MTGDDMRAVPPHNLEAEMAVLGSVLVDRSMLDEIAGLVCPADFYSPRHEQLFAVMLKLAEERQPIDAVTLIEGLPAGCKRDRAGEWSFLRQLMEVVPTASSAAYYARIVREKAALRALIHAGGVISRAGYAGEADVEGAYMIAEHALRQACDRKGPSLGGADLLSALKRNYEAAIDAVYGNRPNLVQKTPWRGLNAYVGGFSPGNLIVWAAAQKAGKSGAVLMLADYIAAHYGAVMFCSIEMPVPDMIRRYVALYSGVSSLRQKSGELSEIDLQLMSDTHAKISDRNVYFFGREQCGCIADMRTEIRALKKMVHTVAIVVDHVGFLRDVDVRGQHDKSSKHERLDNVYRELLRFGNDYAVTVHVVQHVNRVGAKSSQPTASDIRDGGNAEGHAHAVIIPHRPNPIGSAEEREHGEFIIAAIRDGSAGTTPMRFHGGRGMWLDENVIRPWFEMPMENQQKESA